MSILMGTLAIATIITTGRMTYYGRIGAGQARSGGR